MAGTQIIKKALWIAKNLGKMREFSAEQFYADTVDRDLIEHSPYFDAEYYRRNDPALDGCRDLAAHYLKAGGFERLDPSEGFCSDEYLSIHRDVWQKRINPLLNLEKEGRANASEVSVLQLAKDYIRFPSGAESLVHTFSKSPDTFGRTAIVSCYFSAGVIPETLLILLRGIKEAADNIILIGDCPVFPAELKKLDGLVWYADFHRHCQYDFGSYKKGLQFLRGAGALDGGNIHELVMMNDSCYGPVYPFPEVFRNMEKEPCDFWGLTGYRGEQLDHHICSYFMVFRESVLSSNALEAFFERIYGVFDHYKVIALLETKLTRFLREKDYFWQTYRDNRDLDLLADPLTLLKEYRIPLLKKKSFLGLAREDLHEVLAIVREADPELAKHIRIRTPEYHDFRIPSIADHQVTLADKVLKLAGKIRNGEKVRTLFLIPGPDVFPGRGLFDLMAADPVFDPFVVAIPDMRLGEEEAAVEIMRQERLMLASGIPEERLIRVRPDELGRWPDVCEGMDIVCYSTARNFSSFRYQPKYAAGRDFLPILVNGDLPGDDYDPRWLRIDAYRYCWKVFFTSEEILRLYQEYSPDRGTNGGLAADAASLLHNLK